MIEEDAVGRKRPGSRAGAFHSLNPLVLEYRCSSSEKAYDLRQENGNECCMKHQYRRYSAMVHDNHL